MINSGSSHNDSISRRPIAFFMRKGADCLSKWVGESERQLRLLFNQAYRMRPSIIFFDEIDGLAPVRSSRKVFTLNLANLVAFPSSVGMCPEAALAQILSAVKCSMLCPDQNHRPEATIKATTGVVLFIPQVDTLLRRLPHLTAVYLVDRLQSLMNDLVAETVHCALPLVDSPFGLSDLSQAVSQPARRLLLVATVKKRIPNRPRPLKRNIPTSVASSPTQRTTDVRTTPGLNVSIMTAITPIQGTVIARRSNENWSPVSREAWIRALQVVRPSSDRSDMDVSALSGLQPSASALAATKRTMLSPQLAPLLSSTVNQIVELFRIAFKPINLESVTRSAVDLFNPDSSVCLPSVLLSSPKLLLSGDLPDHLVSAVWHRLELVQVNLWL
ncbi:ATPase family AAA domain-containing protein 2 [Fasciola hepatica]|uniref:ATPase family AAA domain-containing protein 2 n=1 Tax=Fasciola hepatica TaxID=6192 RepID=A0A4E0QWS9_FASHE|nr:ATPase family AAA domain-containing protein 2 [Fasciola hepatica]